MPFDQRLAERVRAMLLPLEGYDERKMFGGICFLLHGHMACGILHDRLIVRVGPERYGEALQQPHTTLFDFTGRPMTGIVQVAAEGINDDAPLQRWVLRGVDYAQSLPPKKAKA